LCDILTITGGLTNDVSHTTFLNIFQEEGTPTHHNSTASKYITFVSQAFNLEGNASESTVYLKLRQLEEELHMDFMLPL